MKAFTDLEQSKKLVKILPLESADMTYSALTEGMRDKMTIIDWEVTVGLDIAIKENLFSYREGYILPCWSLAALFNVLPKIVNNETLFVETSATLWHVGYRNVYIARADNLIDACYEMIIKLHEQKLL